MHKWYPLYLLLWPALLQSGCIPPAHEKPDDPRLFSGKKESIYEVGLSLPYYIDYTRAMENLNLEHLMKEDDTKTFFIPLPAAFSGFLARRKINSLEQIPVQELKEILMYHIIDGKWPLSSITTGYYPTYSREIHTRNKIDIYINTNDLIRLNNDPCMDTPDISCSNGMIHSIKSVIGIPDIPMHLSLNTDFTEVMNMFFVDSAGPDLMDLLSGEGPYTFLAPDNKAFRTMFDNHEEWNRPADIPFETKQDIIRNHIVTGINLLMKDLEGAQQATTLYGDKIYIRIEKINLPGKIEKNYIIEHNGISARVSIADIQGKNGVIHQINTVLAP